MHTGILTSDPETPLRIVARLMAQRKVHAVASSRLDTPGSMAIVMAIDVAGAVG